MKGMHVAQMQQTFQIKLRELIAARGISQTKLAQTMGVSVGYVNDYLNGRKGSPGLDVIERFARALGIPAWRLLDDVPVSEFAEVQS